MNKLETTATIFATLSLIALMNDAPYLSSPLAAISTILFIIDYIRYRKNL